MQKSSEPTVTPRQVSRVIQGETAQTTPVPEIYKHLNFKVPPDFHREFKTFAASHDISMTALLIEAFSILREAR